MWVLGFELELLLIHKLMTTSGSIFLAGASRGVGYQIARILATQNLPVLALIRSPADPSDLQALNVETVVGDALNPTDVTNAMNGQIISALVSTIGGLPQDGQRADFLGNKHLIDAAVKNGVSRFILVSSLGAGATKDAIPATAYAALASDAAQNRVISAFDKNMVYGTAAYREFVV